MPRHGLNRKQISLSHLIIIDKIVCINSAATKLAGKLLEGGICIVHNEPESSYNYESLPIVWRMIANTGFAVQGQTYDHERLESYRHRASIGGSKASEKYQIRYDLQNLAEVYFFDFLAKPAQWIVLRLK